jgi:hypothetical protein
MNKEQEKYMHFLWEHSHVFECISVESEIAIITKQQKKQETLLHIHKRLLLLYPVHVHSIFFLKLFVIQSMV